MRTSHLTLRNWTWRWRTWRTFHWILLPRWPLLSGEHRGSDPESTATLPSSGARTPMGSAPTPSTSPPSSSSSASPGLVLDKHSGQVAANGPVVLLGASVRWNAALCTHERREEERASAATASVIGLLIMPAQSPSTPHTGYPHFPRPFVYMVICVFSFVLEESKPRADRGVDNQMDYVLSGNLRIILFKWLRMTGDVSGDWWLQAYTNSCNI